MSIRDWPDGERPREKLLERGGAALSDAELLAIFLGSGRRGQSAVDLGRGLLSDAGSLKSLLDAPRDRESDRHGRVLPAAGRAGNRSALSRRRTAQ